MAISRSDLLKEIMPGLNALFDLEYSKHTEEFKKGYEIEVDFNGTVPVQVADDDGRI